MVVKVMTFEQKDLQLTPEDLEAPAPKSDDLEGSETRRGRLANLVGGSRRYLPGLVFVAGLLLGWLIIGWWLWPVQWTNTAPWHLHREHQKTYIGLVAENFWWTKDIHHAREALAGWDDEAVTELLATMERESSSPETRQQLAALAEALGMPTAEESLWASLLSQKAIFLSVILSALPLAAAIILGVFSFVQNRTQPSEGPLVEEGQLEEALGEMLDREKLALEGEQVQAQEEQAEEKEGEEEEEEEDYEEEDEEEEEEEEEEPWVQDLVSVLFDEDEIKFSQLEALCKKLPDVDVSHLLELSNKVVDQLYKSNALRTG